MKLAFSFVWVSDRHDVIFFALGCRLDEDDIFGFEYGRHAGVVVSYWCTTVGDVSAQKRCRTGAARLAQCGWRGPGVVLVECGCITGVARAL